MMSTTLTHNDMDGKDDKSKNEKKSVTEKYAADPNTAGTGISEIKEKDATPTITTTDPLQVGPAGAGSVINTSTATNTSAKNDNIDEKVEKISHVSESNSIIRPTLHHFGVTTRHLEEMIDWYAKVLGTKPNLQSSLPLGKEASLSAVFVTNDRANHRVALISWSGLRDDPEKHTLKTPACCIRI